MIPTCLNFLRRIRLLPLFCFLFQALSAQIRIDTSLSAEKLVKNVLLGEGVVVGNVIYTGPGHALARFRDSSQILSIHEGIVLSSGSAFMAPGPNKHAGMGWVNQHKGFRKLDSLADGDTHDAAVLAFDFVTSAEVLTFNFIFASEEYPEYVDSKYNDVFGFFINGPGLDHVNLATLPRSKVPVTINSINHKTNKKYFVENPTYTFDDQILYDVRLKKTVKNKNFRKEGGLPKYNIQYDGFTTVLEAVCRVVPGEVYHIELAIADVGDYSLDSGVFLEAHSFRSTGNSYVFTGNPFEKPAAPLEVNRPGFHPDPPENGNKADKPVPEDVKPDEPSPAAPESTHYQIEFPFDSYQLTDSARHQLHKLIDQVTQQAERSVTLTGHTDSMGSDQYNEELSRRRTQAVADFLKAKGIKTAISCRYRGEKQPVESNQSEAGRARNRRVEIELISPLLYKSRTNPDGKR